MYILSQANSVVMMEKITSKSQLHIFLSSYFFQAGQMDWGENDRRCISKSWRVEGEPLGGDK